MMTLIQINQPLFILAALLLFVVIFLWVLQYAIIRYGKKVFTQAKNYWRRLEHYIGLRKQLIQLKTSYPNLYHFLCQRLHVQHFHGLTLTLLLVLMGYILALFIGLIEEVVTADSIVMMDYLVSQQMSLLSESSVVNIFIPITSLASTVTTCLVVFLTSVVCWIVRQRYILVGLIISVIGSTIFTYLTKMVFQRGRPVDILLLETTFSFPSGHATVTIALYGFIAYVAIRFNQYFARRVHIVMFTILLTVLIGLSRILLNEHYLSDVLGGYLVGALWLTVAISTTEWLTSQHKINWQINWSTSQMYLVGFSVVGILISTLIYAAIYQFPLLL